MKRNLDLIRHILLTTENTNLSELSVLDYVTESYSFGDVSYHIELLADAGYLVVLDISTLSSVYSDYLVRRLTNQGHDFLNSIRNDTIFNKTKHTVLSRVGNVALDVIKEIATAIAKNQLGI